MYLVSLGDRVLDTCCWLHVVRNGFIHGRGRSRGQDTMLKRLRVASEAPLLGRKNCFLILQSPLHYELILVRAERPADEEHMTHFHIIKSLPIGFLINFKHFGEDLTPFIKENPNKHVVAICSGHCLTSQSNHHGSFDHVPNPIPSRCTRLSANVKHSSRFTNF